MKCEPLNNEQAQTHQMQPTLKPVDAPAAASTVLAALGLDVGPTSQDSAGCSSYGSSAGAVDDVKHLCEC